MRLVKTGTAFATGNDIHGSPYENRRVFESEYGRQLLDLVDLDARTLLEGLKKRMLKRRKDKRGGMCDRIREI